MSSDEQQIRELTANWIAATRAGDLQALLPLMTDDVVFLGAGRPPMNKTQFERAATPPPGRSAPQMEANSDIQEIVVSGDWAFMWTELSVVVTAEGVAPVERAGYTLTVLRKEHGAWRIARDANLLSSVPRP
jgi:uncharacterized protein (TIGR02246 family)